MEINYCGLRQRDERYVFHNFPHGASLPPQAQHCIYFKHYFFQMSGLCCLLKMAEGTVGCHKCLFRRVLRNEGYSMSLKIVFFSGFPCSIGI